MTQASHEDVMVALFALVSSAQTWGSAPSRRLKLWTEVDPSLRPALFQFEGGNENNVWGKDAVKREPEVKLFVYFDAKDPTKTGASQVNATLDAIANVLKPAGRDLMFGRQTLGGLVTHARIEGAVFKDPGDLDGDGLLIVPVKILMP